LNDSALFILGAAIHRKSLGASLRRLASKLDDALEYAFNRRLFTARNRLPTKPQHPDVPNYPKSPHSKPVTLSTKPGEYVFVQDADGVVHAVPQAPHAHPTVLGGGEPAAAAGEITIGPNGVVTEINNISGTFQHDASVLPGVKNALEGGGFKVAPDAIKPFQW